MGTKKRIIKNYAYIVVWGVAQNTLRAGVLHKDAYDDVSGEYMPLDKTLLPLLQKHEKNFDSLKGIAIVASGLGGFVSSRLLLATLNTYAWLHHAPIVSIPASWQQKDVPALFRAVEEHCKHTRPMRQVLPEYGRPADTTISKKKKKFTLT